MKKWICSSFVADFSEGPTGQQVKTSRHPQKAHLQAGRILWGSTALHKCSYWGSLIYGNQKKKVYNT